MRSLAAIALIGWEGSSIASNALRRDAYARLAAARESKRRQIEDYLRDLRNLRLKRSRAPN